MKLFKKIRNFFSTKVIPTAKDLLIKSLLVVVDCLDYCSMFVFGAVHGVANYWATSM